MRILVQIRPDYRQRPGGDTVQAEHLVDGLREIGLAADLSGALAPDLAAYDLVHVFNTQRIDAPFRQTLHARNCGKPIVLSPIYWDLDPYRRATRTLAPGVARGVAMVERRERAMQAAVIGAAALVLPNSQAEAALLRANFSTVLTDTRVRVVLNGADARLARGDAARFCARYGLEERAFVLCVARKDAPKNQLRLIEACGALGLPLVLAGVEPPDAAAYVAACRELAGRTGTRTLFLPHLDVPDLADAYAAARVHVLASFYETVGLSSLEASLAGCNVVAVRVGGIEEYLGDTAWYCDPASVDSIRDAVAGAYAAPLRSEPGAPVASRYTWRRAAELTARAYEEIMRQQSTSQEQKTSTQWLPDLSPGEYIAHLEDLIQLQLDVIEFRDFQYADLVQEHERLQTWARELEAGVKDLQARPTAGPRSLRATLRHYLGRLRRFPRP